MNAVDARRGRFATGSKIEGDVAGGGVAPCLGNEFNAGAAEECTSCGTGFTTCLSWEELKSVRSATACENCVVAMSRPTFRKQYEWLCTAPPAITPQLGLPGKARHMSNPAT